MQVPKYYANRLPQQADAPRMPFTNPENQGLMDVAGGLADFAAAKQKYDNDLATAEASNWLVKFQDEYRNKWKDIQNTQQGSLAVGLTGRLSGDFDKRIEEYAKGMSERSAPTFRKLAQAVRGSMLNQAQGYETQQTAQYRKDTIAGLSTNAAKSMALFPFDDRQAEFSLGILRANLEQYLPPEEAAVEFEKQKKDLLYGRLSAMVDSDMGRAEAYLEQWKDDLGIDKYLAAKNFIKTRKNEAVAAAEKAEREAAEARKKEVEDNDFQAWIDFYDNKLSPSDLDGRANGRDISEGAYRGIKSAMEKGEKVEDDPMTVIELWEDINYGREAKSKIIAALKDGRIKGETAKDMIKAETDTDRKEASAYVQNALKPGLLERWNPDKNVKYAEAQDRVNKLINRGSTPMQAAYQVVREYTDGIRRTWMGLRKPTYLTGDKRDVHALQTAEMKTAQAFYNKEIGESQYKEEVELIRSLLDLAAMFDDIDNVSDEAKKRAKDAIRNSPE